MEAKEATPPPRRSAASQVGEAIVVTAIVTAVVTAASRWVDSKYVALAVGFVFLAATWALVWGKDDDRVRRYGLTLGGLVMPGKLQARELAKAALRSFAWALGFAAVVFAPFYIGWRYWWAPKLGFSLAIPPLELANEAFGQLVVIALPEEAFYRGYVQSRIDDALPSARARTAGASIGPGLFIASVVFALGHVATIPQPARLAVFFPSLLFGWLRARTGGIGASIVFHALCNVFSEMLGRGFGVY
jgi:membrane protease YdiL (CAAX protease family)